MKSQNPGSRSIVRRWVDRVLWVAGSFVVFVLVFFDPLGIHPIDGWLQASLGYHTGEMVLASDEATGQLWTCPMHPHILEDDPADCPICGINCVPAAGGASAARPA